MYPQKFQVLKISEILRNVSTNKKKLFCQLMNLIKHFMKLCKLQTVQ